MLADGCLFLATDNDGVDENDGETPFFALDDREPSRLQSTLARLVRRVLHR